MKSIATMSENKEYFYLTVCSINLNMASVSDTENVQLVFNLDSFVMNRARISMHYQTLKNACIHALSYD